MDDTKETKYKTDFLVAQPSFLSGMARLADFRGLFDDYNRTPEHLNPDARAFNNDLNVVLQDLRNAVKEEQQKLRGEVE